MNSYFLCVTQPTNLGDLIINKMLVMELSRYGRVYVDCKKTPREFADYLVSGNENIVDVYESCGVSVKSGSLLKWSKFLRNKKIDVYVTSPGPLIKENRIKSSYFTLISCVLKMLNVSNYKIGVCCSELLADSNKLNLSGLSGIYLRSKVSLNSLVSQGNNNIRYIPDLAFLLRQYVKLAPKKNLIALSFREVKEKSELFILTLRSVIEYFLANNYEVEFYYQVSIDEEYNRKLAEKFRSEHVRFVENKIWFDTLDYYADKKYVVSNRLHSLVTGAVYDAIPLALVNTDSKVRKIEEVLCSSMNNPNRYFINPENISNVRYIEDNYQNVKAEIHSDVDANCKLCKETIGLLSSFEN